MKNTTTKIPIDSGWTERESEISHKIAMMSWKAEVNTYHVAIRFVEKLLSGGEEAREQIQAMLDAQAATHD